MEIFSHTHATSYGRRYAVTAEEYLQESLEPPDRLTKKELQQLREIREEIESRPRLTRFELRYIKLLNAAEQEFCDLRPNHGQTISRIRKLLREADRTVTVDKRAIAFAFLFATIATGICQRQTQ